MIRRVLDIYVEEAPVLMPASAAVFVLTGILTGVLVAAGPGPALIALRGHVDHVVCGHDPDGLDRETGVFA